MTKPVSRLLIELPKSCFGKQTQHVLGANVFAQKVSTELIKAFPGAHIIVTDATKEDVDAFSAEYCNGIPLKRVSYDTLPYVLKSGDVPDIGFVTGLNIGMMMKVRNALKCHFPVVGLVHFLGSKLTLETLSDVYRNTTEMDAILCPSESIKQTIEKAEDIFLESTRKPTLFVAPHGIDSRLFVPKTSTVPELRQKHGIPSDKTVISLISRLNPYTKMDVTPFIFQMKKALERHDNLHVLIVGEVQNPGYFKQLEYFVSANNLQDKVQFITQVAHETIHEYYQLTDIYVSLTDNISESFGLTVVEAMACGIPVIISDCAGYQSLDLQHKKEGFLVPTISAEMELDLLLNTGSTAGYGDASIQSVACDYAMLHEAVDALVEDPELRQQCGQNARKKVESSFSIPKMIDTYIDIFNEVLTLQDDAVVSYPDLPVRDVFELFSHGVTRLLQPQDILEITPYGKAIIQNKEPFLAFEKHLEYYQLISAILTRLFQQSHSVESLYESISADHREINANCVYLIKHDVLRIKSL
jgi:glycosyltransferase involved in cell wall biosynthesis